MTGTEGSMNGCLTNSTIVSTKIDLSVLNYELDRVAELVRKEVEYGTDINVILNDALIAAMGEVGDEFSNGRLSRPRCCSRRRRCGRGSTCCARS